MAEKEDNDDNFDYITIDEYVNDDIYTEEDRKIKHIEDDKPTYTFPTSGYDSPPSSPTEAVIQHKCFKVFSGRGKGSIGTKTDRILFIINVLKVNIADYTPPHLMNDASIKACFNTNTAFDTNPRKWKLGLLSSHIWF